MQDFLQSLKGLSSAEDFLQFFGVPFDQDVVHVSRLHILKRFFQYIRQETALPLTDQVRMFAVYRTLLMRAYGDFLTSTPAREKVFKVFQDADGKQHVSLESLKASMPRRSLA